LLPPRLEDAEEMGSEGVTPSEPSDEVVTATSLIGVLDRFVGVLGDLALKAEDHEHARTMRELEIVPEGKQALLDHEARMTSLAQQMELERMTRENRSSEIVGDVLKGIASIASSSLLAFAKLDFERVGRQQDVDARSGDVKSNHELELARIELDRRKAELDAAAAMARIESERAIALANVRGAFDALREDGEDRDASRSFVGYAAKV